MNYNETKQLLTQYLLARIPFIGINTIEKGRALELLSEISKQTNMNMKVHSMSKGFTNLIFILPLYSKLLLLILFIGSSEIGAF